MIKVKPLKVEKIWGYELWVHSTYPDNPTFLETGEKTTKGPLIKIIKSNRPLSVQVHPDDKLAKELENQPNGKSECWYVMEANEDTEYIVGIKSFDPELIRNSLKDKTFMELLKIHKPTVGDFINVPAGLVHGIGKNSKVLEVQQPSDTTYRFYDYDRLENGKPRELHIEKSIKSIKDLDWKQNSNSNDFQSHKCEGYTIDIHHKKHHSNKGDIVVNLKKEEAYISEGEEIEFEHYAIIKY